MGGKKETQEVGKEKFYVIKLTQFIINRVNNMEELFTS
jgi:hypothetical protein